MKNPGRTDPPLCTLHTRALEYEKSDENSGSLLCYQDDLMVFVPNEELALEHLEMVFSLKNHKLKIAPKKCHLLKRSVRFLGHVICAERVRTDKVKPIGVVGEAELMESDGVMSSWRKIRSFLGMVLSYQHFIIDCSAKTLLTLECSNFGEPFILAVDATFDGTGAALLQVT